MDFLKFKMLRSSDHQGLGDGYEILLINKAHLVSIKPINMVLEDRVVQGFWVRTSNGKKYRAIEIPTELRSLFGDHEFFHED